MAGYDYIELKVNNGELNLDNLNNDQLKILDHRYVIYIYRSITNKKFYIGQTKNFKERNKEHHDGREQKFNSANFNEVIILFSQYFNGSSLDDVESQLITYFIADNQRSRSYPIQYSYYEVINLTMGNSIAEYQNREDISSKVILPFWSNVLYPKKWVKSKTIDKLRDEELVKYSPIKILTEQQQNIINDILKHPTKSYVINGDAGTGKTILLTHLVAKLIKKNEKNKNNKIRIGVVVQPNWEDIAKKIFKVYGLLNNDNLTVATSTTLIKQKDLYDIIIVDESHKLSRRHNKQMASFNSVYNIKKFSNCKSHLEILKKLGKQMVLMYDVLQAIRPANITRADFRELTADFEQRTLSTQFRVQVSVSKSYTSDDYINGIKYLLYKDTNLLQYTNYNPDFDKSLFQDNADDAYFGYFEDKPLHKLSNWIDSDRNFHPEHINRVLAGLVEPWKIADGKDINKTQWHEKGYDNEPDLNLRWNSTQKNWLQSKDTDAKDQIGSVFAVQGIDLNKVGVLIGKDLQVNKDNQLVGDPSHFYNVNGKFSKEDYDIPTNKTEFTIYVLNIYYVLLTRGIDGIRIGFWHNDKFKKYFKETLEC
ncbi:hypothetical protein DS831_06140 [Bombilactobacillus bombi]|uniref:GIY-YIG domain-containing protein n=2 Tax=Bombilactobacillus bombi TaxID=1303590 RepID=A0A417ZEL7_9LACO|nr:hypothetical protein DS831_06140 [Bombilactobacillus bombi]